MAVITDVKTVGRQVVLHVFDTKQGHTTIPITTKNARYVENHRAVLNSFENIRDFQAFEQGGHPRLKLWYYDNNNKEVNKNFNNAVGSDDWVECNVFGY